MGKRWARAASATIGAASIFLATACSGNSNSAADSASGSQATTTVTVTTTATVMADGSDSNAAGADPARDDAASGASQGSTADDPASDGSAPDGVTNDITVPNGATTSGRTGQPTSPAAPAISGTTIATVDPAGVVTVRSPKAVDPIVIAVYEDAMCPFCAAFEQQHGDAVRSAVAAGELAVKYRMVNFLNRASASGTYSTRAYAALLAVAKYDGDLTGVAMTFHSLLFAPLVQPKEGGSADLSNDELAALAKQAGASPEVQRRIAAGEMVHHAGAAASANLQSLAAVAASVGGKPGTPTVAHDGTPLNLRSAEWLPTLLAAK